MFRKSILVFCFTVICVISLDTYTEEIAVTKVNIKDIALSADFNRDGKILYSQQLIENNKRTDFNTEEKPYVFWVNNDDDDENSETSGYDVTAQSGWFEFDGQDPDIDNQFIDGSRDLIDFFAVGVDLYKYLTTTTDYDKKSYLLQHEDEAVNIVYTVMSRGSGGGADLSSDYLNEIDMNDVKSIFGDWQTAGQLSEVPVYKVTRDGIEIPKDFIELIKNDENKGVILVEGSSESSKPLKLIINDENNNQLVDASLPLKIYDVTSLYRQVSLRGYLNGVRRDEVSMIWGESPTSMPPDVVSLLSSLTFQATNIAIRSPEVDTGRHVIHVHGFNNDEQAATAFQSETFKRLFHSGSNTLFTGVHWRGDQGIPAGLNYWDNVENAFYVADDLAALVNGISGEKIIIAHSLGNMVAGSAIQDFGMSFDKYFMVDPAVALEAYDANEEHPREMHIPAWDEYYFGDDYDANADTENYSGIRSDGKNGRRLWSVEWHTLFPNADARSKLTWRDRFSLVAANTNVVQYYSTGEEVLQPGSVGDPFDLDPVFDAGRNAWNIQEKSKGTSELAAILGGGSSAGWGFNEVCETDIYGNEICVPNNFLSHSQAQTFFDKTTEDLIQNPFFDPFENALLTDISSGGAAVNTTYPHDLAYEIPALSFASGGTRSIAFPDDRAIDMNTRLADGWPQERGGFFEREWFHSDFKDVSYRYTYMLYDDFVVKGSLR